jgi:hypothetical protein
VPKLVPICVCLLASLTPGCGEEAPPRALERNIINGKTCLAADMPSALAILIEGKIDFGAFGSFPFRTVLCTGTLIAPDVVLTAAHCTFPDLLTGGMGKTTDVKYHISFTPDLSSLVMDMSGKVPELPADAAEVSLAVAHPQFDPAGLTQITPGPGNLHDIALMFLAKPIPATQAKPAIVITKEEASQLVVGKAVEIAGWGQQTPAAQNPFQPPPAGTVGIKVCATSTINEVAQYELQIGAGSETSRKCHGDSGGPSYATVESAAASKGRVVGITSHAYDQTDCAKGGIDTRVDAWLEWLEQEMSGACAQKKRAWCEVTGIIPPKHYDPKLPEPRPDIGADGAVAGDGEVPPAGGGCGCDAGRSGSPRAPLAVGLAALLIVGGRARRRRYPK